MLGGESVCSAPVECTANAYCRGLCVAHYQQHLLGRPFRKYPWTPEDRFWSRVDKNDPESCWLWTGPLNRGGYGKFTVGRENWSTHRYSYFLAYGELPEPPRQLDHTCEIRNCVNPDHLRDVSPRGNVESRSDKGWGALGTRNVSYDASRGAYIVTVQSGGRSYFGGRFPTLEEAKVRAEELRKDVFSSEYRSGPVAGPASAPRPGGG